jgi:hypothetical protein
VIRFLVCVCCVLVLCPATAFAQGEDSDWAAGSGGDLAFLAKDDADVSWLRIIGPGGEVSAPEAVAEAYANPIVAVGARGDAIVVWIGEADDALHARYRPPGGVLGAPELVAPNADFRAETVTAGVDGAGNATVTWTPERDDERGGMWVRTRSPAGVWGEAQNLGGYRVFAPSLAVTDNGTALLAWRQSKTPKHPNLNQVAVSGRAPGGTFAPARVLAGINRDPGEPTVAANDRGDAVVVWSELKPHDEFSVWAAFRGPGTRFGAPARLNHERDMVSRWISVLADGAMVMGWTNNVTRHAEARVRSAAGTLGRPVVLTRDLEVNSDLFPLTTGAIAWADRDPGVSRIRLATVDGLGFRAPIDVVRVRGWFLGPAFSAGPAGVAIVPRPPLHAADAIRWQRVPTVPGG